MVRYGLQEQVINRMIENELRNVSENRKSTEPIDEAEASRVLTQYICAIVKKALDRVRDSGQRLSGQIELVNRIVSLISREVADEALAGKQVEDGGNMLVALLKENDVRLVTGKTASSVVRPVTSLANSSLFTGASREPQLAGELAKEIVSADRIDWLVSFVKWSGLRLLMEPLREFTARGGRLRIITTSYMGATDIKAVDELHSLPNTTVRVSYDTKRTRLHAKTYVFHRDSGFSTAYIGSSNLSGVAMSSGLEWNLKITQSDLPDTMDKIRATFDAYWNASEFEQYGADQRERLERALHDERAGTRNQEAVFALDIYPYYYQQEILDRLDAERSIHGHTKNLVVAATGTGKTVISAFDYRRFCQQHTKQPNRLLFVAHREEILSQSLGTFRAVLKDPNFGELFVGRNRAQDVDYLFVSIQTLNSRDLAGRLPKDYYDYIVVDEFHHAAAPSYQKLLTHFAPKILLGLTATPERMDGKSILEYFDGRVSAEIRLPEAIDRKLLCPFQYFGVTDDVSLEKLKWSRGGYDRTELSNLYTLNQKVSEHRAEMIVHAMKRYLTDMDTVKGLGFCVSQKHAEFMAAYFNSRHIPSIYLTGESDDGMRKEAKSRLTSGEIRFVFVVDIYNEGVDIPEVDTILFLRPTESLTIFLQQLGRGLRLAPGKECLTVLDFIGQANRKYRFAEKFSALLSRSDGPLEKEVQNGFVSVPKGCYIHLEKMASRYILENIRASFGRTDAFVRQARTFEEDSGLVLSLQHFLDYFRLDPRILYRYSSFSRVCVKAGKRRDFAEPVEKLMEKAFPKFAVINSRRLIDFILEILGKIDSLEFERMSGLMRRMFQMFYVTVWGKPVSDWAGRELADNMAALRQSPVMRQELSELLSYQRSRIDFVDEPVALGFDSPLYLHCNYTRDQLFVALDWMTPKDIREGVKYIKEKKLDVLLVTLNKSDKDYSPTTLYEDYSISESLFHWQSQSTTSETSQTGERYINHQKRGSMVLLFVREEKNDRLLGSSAAETYTFLGKANYVSHTGSRPMSIIWRLDRPIPARFIAKTDKLGVA